jgi:hypothetical protein
VIWNIFNEAFGIFLELDEAFGIFLELDETLGIFSGT